MKDCTSVLCIICDVFEPDALLQFHPAGGPVEGGTKLTVSGVNLGKAAADLAVTVAGAPCTVVDDTYVPSERCSMLYFAISIYLLRIHQALLYVLLTEFLSC